MSRKKDKMAEVIAQWEGQGADPHLVGYMDCFNRGLFYEAHDVLEQLWLKDRDAVDGLFFKGLIQLAGAFVHLQKNRLHPSAALFKLARANFQKYPADYHHVNLAELLQLTEKWLAALEAGRFQTNPLNAASHPKLALKGV